MLQSSLAKITTLIAVAIVAWAVARGRWPERIAAMAVGIDWAAAILFQDRRYHHHGQPAIFAFDVAMEAVLFDAGAAVRAHLAAVGRSAWPAAHSHPRHGGPEPAFGQWSYMTAIYIWSLGILLALGLGVWLEGGRPVRPVAWSR